MLVVDRHLGSVRGGVKDLGKGATVRFDSFGGAGISDLGEGVVAESTLEVVAGVDVLKKPLKKILLKVI